MENRLPYDKEEFLDRIAPTLKRIEAVRLKRAKVCPINGTDAWGLLAPGLFDEQPAVLADMVQRDTKLWIHEWRELLQAHGIKTA